MTVLSSESLRHLFLNFLRTWAISTVRWSLPAGPGVTSSRTCWKTTALQTTTTASSPTWENTRKTKHPGDPAGVSVTDQPLFVLQSCTSSGADFTDLAEIVSRIEPVQGYVTEGERSSASTRTCVHHSWCPWSLPLPTQVPWRMIADIMNVINKKVTASTWRFILK